MNIKKYSNVVLVKEDYNHLSLMGISPDLQKDKSIQDDLLSGTLTMPLMQDLSRKYNFRLVISEMDLS